MNNVIAFPKANAGTEVRDTGGATLFLHIRQTSLIAYLAPPRRKDEARIGTARKG